MDDPTLIRLYLDQYRARGPVEEPAIAVTDVQTYAAARRAIEDLKDGARPGSLTVVVQSPQFFPGFNDLALLGKLVQITRIAPRDEIEDTWHIEVPRELTDHDLIALGVEKPADLLAPGRASGIRDEAAFDDALLVKAFGSSVFSSHEGLTFGDWISELLSFLHGAEPSLAAGWHVAYTRHLAEQRVQGALECYGRADLGPFLADALRATSDGRGWLLLNQMAARKWLASYSKLAQKAVLGSIAEQAGQWVEVKNQDLVLEAIGSWCEALYEQAGPLVDLLEQVLALKLGEGDLIEDEDPRHYIGHLSGHFAAEYEAAQARLAELLLRPGEPGDLRAQSSAFSTHCAQLDSLFAPLLRRIGQYGERLGWIKLLVEFNDVLAHLQQVSATNWGDWVATYELLIRARQLRWALHSAVPSRYVARLSDLLASASMLDERLNVRFSDWLLGVYPKALAEPVAQPPLVLNGARLALDCVGRGGRAILLVLDGVDWDMWRHLRSALAREGFATQGGEAAVAMIPTITEFSRRAILGGLPPSTLASFVDDVYGTEIAAREEAKILARALGYLSRVEQLSPAPSSKRILRLANDLVFVNGGAKDLAEALQLDAKCYAFVYGEIDSHIHVSKLEEPRLRATANQWLEDLASEIAHGVRENPVLRDESHLQVIVTSDHGFLDISDKGRAELEIPAKDSLNVERHGRLAIVSAKSEEDAASMEDVIRFLRTQCATSWHVLTRDQAAAYGLATASPTAGHIVAWLMPKLHRYVARGKGNYVHGGVSMYESIVPSAVLVRGEVEIVAPTVALSGHPASQEDSEISIAVLNNNDRSLASVAISLPDFGLTGLTAGSIGPGGVAKLVAQVVAPKSGDILVQIEVDVEIERLARHFRQTCVLTVQPGRRERMRASTRRASLDEEE